MSIDFENLKKEDFDTKAPFEYLFSIESKFERWTERRKLEKKAGDLGLAKKDFTEMCKAFEADMKEKRRKAEEERKQAERQKREQEEAERQALRELQEEERQRKREEAMQELPAMNSIDVPGFDLDFVPCTGEWLVNSSGVYKFTGFGQQIWACLCPVAISRCFVNIDSGNEHVELVFKSGNNIKQPIIPISQFAKPKQLVELADIGLRVNENMAKYLSDYLTEFYSRNIDVIPCGYSVGRLGWIGKEKFSPYCDGLEYDGRPEYKAVFDSVKPHGSYDEWIRQAIAFRRESTAARIVLAASFASVLVQPLECLPFFVHLWGGDSGTGKTVALMAAASVWANPETGKFIRTFDSTDVGNERTAAFLNSLPMCVDELQLSKDARGQVVFNPYRLAEGAGRTRGNRSGGVDVTPTWRNAILTTGETPLNKPGAGAGAVNRVVDIECTSNTKVVQDGHAVAAAFRANYGFAGKAFVEQLLVQDNLTAAKGLYATYFRQLNTSATTDKQAMAAALIVTADTLATEWIFKDNYALQASDIAPYLASRENVSAGKRGYEYMLDWVAQNVNRFDLNQSGDVYGLIEGDWVFIIKGVFDEAASEGGYDSRALLSYLKINNLIRVNGYHNTVPKTKLKGKPRCVCMFLGAADGSGDEAELPQQSELDSIFPKL